MDGIWDALAEKSRSMKALNRQGMADAIWPYFLLARYAKTGQAESLDFLIPYLQHADKSYRSRALDVTARIYDGAGQSAIADLEYITKNADLRIRDRSVHVVAACLKTLPPAEMLSGLAGYISHKNHFIRAQALRELGQCGYQTGSKDLLNAILDIRNHGNSQLYRDLALSRIFSGNPTDEVYCRVAKPEFAAAIDNGNSYTTALLVRGDKTGYRDMALEAVLRPRLETRIEGWLGQLIRRDGVIGMVVAFPDKPGFVLESVLPVIGEACVFRASLAWLPSLFQNSEDSFLRDKLIQLAESDDERVGTVAIACLGRYLRGSDEEIPNVLRDACHAKSSGLQAQALLSLGMAAEGTADSSIMRLLQNNVGRYDLAVASILSMGFLNKGLGEGKATSIILNVLEDFTVNPKPGRRSNKRIRNALLALGLAYAGTGLDNPVEVLFEYVSLPAYARNAEYRRCAARALTMIQFPEPRIQAVFGDVDIMLRAYDIWEYTSFAGAVLPG